MLAHLAVSTGRLWRTAKALSLGFGCSESGVPGSEHQRALATATRLSKLSVAPWGLHMQASICTRVASWLARSCSSNSKENLDQEP